VAAISAAALATTAVLAQHASAQVAVVNTFTAADSASTANFTQSDTVSSSADVLVLAFAYKSPTEGDPGTGNAAGNSPATITFGSQTMTLGYNVTVPNAVGGTRNVAVYYLDNPTTGAAETLTAAFNTANDVTTAYSIQAFTLSGVNTSVAPITGGYGDPTSTSNTTVSATASGVTSGSFAFLGNAVGNGANNTISFSSSSGTAATLNSGLQDPNAQQTLGVGDVTNITAASPTFTATNTASNDFKNVLAYEVFTASAVAPTLTWGGQTNSTWDNNVTQNWYNGNVSSTFVNSDLVTLGDNQYSGGPLVTNDSITIAAGGVSPGSVTFTNTNVNGVSYTLTSSDSNGIKGTASVSITGNGSVTLNGTYSYTGATTNTAGNLTLNGTLGSAGGTAISNSATFNESSTGVIAGTSSVSNLAGNTTLSGNNTYTGTTSAQGGAIYLNGINKTSGLNITNAAIGGLTVVSLRNVGALGNSSVNTALAPITMNATGTLGSTSILEIGATIGTDPGGHNADFSYQVVSSNPNTTPGLGQINLGYTGENSDDGVGFAAYNANSLSTPRIIALYTPVANSTTLATLQFKSNFGQGSGDHLTMGSLTSNDTAILLNSMDLNGGPLRRFASIRGVGNVPEGQLNGAIINSAGSANSMCFDGNGGLILNNNATSYTAGSLQIDGGAVFAAAADPAQPGQTGALGEGNTTLQIGTSSATNPATAYSAGFPNNIFTTATANLAFMTYGNGNGLLNQGVTPSPGEITDRNISVGGSGVTYANVTLGTATDDYSAMNGNIALNETSVPTTFNARNGGRCDFGGVISGGGSVIVGNSIVEGDGTYPGIAYNNNGTIVFNGADSYTGSTTVSAGKLYVDGSITASSGVTVASAATLGGTGSIAAPVSVNTGGFIEAGQGKAGTLTLTGGLAINGNSTIVFDSLTPVGSPTLVASSGGGLTLGGGVVPTIDVTASISGAGNYSLIAMGNALSSSNFNLPVDSLPNRAQGFLFTTGDELDLDITSLSSIVWTGNQSTSWDTTSTNWIQQSNGHATQYIDSPGDSVIFQDPGGNVSVATTTVAITAGDVHPTSVTFNNNTSTYIITGNHAIAGSTGLTLNGTGNVILENANTFSGATSIASGGTLQLGNGTSGNDGSITNTSSITNNGTLAYDLFGSETYAGVIGGSGALNVTGPGKIILTNANTYGGGTTISSGTLQLGTGTSGNDGTVAGNIIDNGAVIFDYFSPTGVTFAGNISGNGALIKSGAGMLVLGGSSYTATGGVTISAGTLQLTSGLGNLGPVNGALTINGGTLDLNGTSQNFGALNGTGGTILDSLTSSASTVTVGNGNTSGTFGGAIANGAGTVGLTMTGTGTQALTGSSTYTGGTSISSGTLQLGNGTSGHDGSVAGNIADNGTLAYDLFGTETYSGVISGSGAVNVIGPGTIILANSNTYGGGTSITKGTLSISNDAALGASTGGVLINGGTLAVTTNTVTATHDITVGASGGTISVASQLNLSGGSSLLDGSGALTVNGGGVLVSSSTNGYSGALSISGNGTKVYVDSPSFGASSVAVGSGARLGGTGTVSNAVTVAAGGALEAGQNSAGQLTLASGVTFTGASSVDIGNLANYTVNSGDAPIVDQAGVTTGGNAVSFVFNGTLPTSGTYPVFSFVGANSIPTGFTTSNPVNQTLSVHSEGGGVEEVQVTLGNNFLTWNNNTANSQWDIATSANWLINGSGPQSDYYEGSSVVFDNTPGSNQNITIVPASVNPASVTFNNTSAVNYTIGGGAIAGSTAVTIQGNGTETFTGSNTYSGGTSISSGGTLSIASDKALGTVPASPATNLTLNNGTLQVTATTAYQTPTISTNRGISLGASGGTINITAVGNGTYFTNERAVQYEGAITGSGGLTVTGSGSGNNTGTNPYLLELATGQNTYGGNTTINNATVTIESGAAVGNFLPATTVVNLVNNGWLVLQTGGESQTVAGLNGDSSGIVAITNGVSAASLIVDPASNQTYSFAGTIGAQTLLGKAGANGGMSVAINGPGTQVFTGSNSYGGGTTISAGTLLANNTTGSATGAGAVTVNGTGKLAGNGFVTGNITLSGSGTAEQGGFIGAGASASTVGTLTTGFQTWNGGGAYAWKINSVGTASPSGAGAMGTGGGGSSNLTIGSETNDVLNMSGLTVTTAATPVDIKLLNTASVLNTYGQQYSWTIAQVSAAPTVNGTTLATTANTDNSGNLLSASNALANGSGSAVFALDTSAFTIDSAPPVASGFTLEFVGNGAGTGDNLVLDYVNYSAVPEPGTALLVLGGAAPMLMGRRRRRKVDC
jgi:autotransporter-associated beta strand protein